MGSSNGSKVDIYLGWSLMTPFVAKWLITFSSVSDLGYNKRKSLKLTTHVKNIFNFLTIKPTLNFCFQRGNKK